MIKKALVMGMGVVLITILFSGKIPAGRVLKIAFDAAVPPWVISRTHQGILIDVAEKTLEPEGYGIEPVYLPYARRINDYKTGKVDAVVDINPNVMEIEGLDGYLSNTTYAYENIGVSLKKRGFEFKTISDLAGHKVLSWQGAKTALGKEYAEMVRNNKRYAEIVDQKKQIRLLYFGRVDIIQLDRQIFWYYRNKVAREGWVDTNQAIDIFPLFGKNVCGFLFRNKEIRDKFDKRFMKLKRSGRYGALIENYVK